MKKLTFLLLTLLLVSCTGLIEKPKNLVSKDIMAELIADFAVNEQMMSVVENTNLDNATRYALLQKKIKGKDFNDSFKYYTATGDINNILDRAQKIILKKDPAAKEYIEKQLKESRKTPELAR